jgi:hypothetical protein
MTLTPTIHLEKIIVINDLRICEINFTTWKARPEIRFSGPALTPITTCRACSSN